MKPALVWFKTDLRIKDNPALNQAARNGRPCAGIYVFDPAEFAPISQKLPWARTGPHRARFLLESVAHLKENLQALGSDLVVAFGKPEEIIPEVLREIQADTLISSQEVCTEELATLAKVRATLPEGVKLELTQANIIFPPLDNKRVVDVFTPFSRELTKSQPIPCQTAPTGLTRPVGLRGSELPTPEQVGAAKTKHPDSSVPGCGGEAEGELRAAYYIEGSKRIFLYPQTRNGLEGQSYSTKFSPWLALGCLSARDLYHRTKRFGLQEGKLFQTQKFLDEMTWREFFWHIAKKHGANFFLEGGIQSRAFQRKPFNAAKFETWRTGQTKNRLINAIMKELLLTGFTSNRGRQIAASYLIHDLGQPWTAGAWWFQHALIDFDPTQNWGNWLHASGRGTDPVPDRRFNPSLQAQKFDPRGSYQARWA